MADTLITVAMGAGGLAAAVATVGLCVSVGVGGAPDPISVGLLVAGMVVFAVGFVSNFEHQSRLWADQMEAQLQARRRALQSFRAIPGQSPRMH